MSGAEKIKIDVVSVPFSGHLYPALTLVHPLLQAGHSVRVFTGDEKADLVTGLGFEAVAILADRPKIMENIANTSMQADFWGMLAQFNQTTALIEEIALYLKKKWQKSRPDIVVADFISVSAGLACRELGIPWITTIASPFAIESTTSVPTYVGGWKPHRSLFYRWRDAFGRKGVHLFKKAAFAFYRNNLGKYRDFQLYDENGYERIYSPHSILGLGMKEMEFRDDFPPQFRWVGYHCLSFEEAGRVFKGQDLPYQKKVLITCGSHLLWVKRDLYRIAAFLAKRYPDYLFVITLGNRKKMNQPPKQAAPNVTVYPYLPYHQILPEVDYVIHHGGAGILYNCIEYGKPALIIPRDYDQFDYAARAEYFGIAKVCVKGKEGCIVKAFVELVADEEQTRLLQMQRAWQQYQPTEVLTEEIERLLGKKISR